MFGQFYSGDYVYRNLLNVPPFGEGNLGGLGASEADVRAEMDRKLSEIGRMINELEAKSRQTSRLVESAAPGIATDVSLWGLVSWGGGATAQKYLNMRDAANAIYEKADSLIRSWTQEMNSWGSGAMDVGATRVYHQRFIEMIAEYDKFLGIVEEASEQRREHPTGEPKGFFDEIKSVLILGLVGYAAIKFGPDIVKSFRK